MPDINDEFVCERKKAMIAITIYAVSVVGNQTECAIPRSPSSAK
jgi:hypothetical protein